MKTVAQALAYAKGVTDSGYRFGIGKCLTFVVTAYDVFIAPGPGTASQAYQDVNQHGQGASPAGAVHWWLGGQRGAGHITVGIDETDCYSTDFGPMGYIGDGTVHVCPVAAISAHDSLLTYKGWSYDLNGYTVVPKVQEAKMILVQKQGVSTVYRYDGNHLQQLTAHQTKRCLELGAVLKVLPASDDIWTLPFDR